MIWSVFCNICLLDFVEETDLLARPAASAKVVRVLRDMMMVMETMKQINPM
jgi:hypothetical protein